MRLHKTLLSISFSAICALTAPVAFADQVYQVTVNTSSALLTNGYIDFQFNPSSFATQPANASVEDFSTDGVLNPTDPDNSCCNNSTIGEASGQLPGTVSLINSETTNEYTEAMTFGTTITFDLDLSGPAIDNPNGEGGGTFTLDFLNSDQSAYLFTDDPLNDVPVFTVNINPDGSTSASTYSSQNDGPPVVTFSGPTYVPEPSMVLLLAGGLLGIAALRRKHRHTA